MRFAGEVGLGWQHGWCARLADRQNPSGVVSVGFLLGLAGSWWVAVTMVTILVAAVGVEGAGAGLAAAIGGSQAFIAWRRLLGSILGLTKSNLAEKEHRNASLLSFPRRLVQSSVAANG